MVCLKMTNILLRSCASHVSTKKARIQLPFMTEDVLLIVADLRMVLHCLFFAVLIDASKELGKSVWFTSSDLLPLLFLNSFI